MDIVYISFGSLMLYSGSWRSVLAEREMGVEASQDLAFISMRGYSCPRDKTKVLECPIQ